MTRIIDDYHQLSAGPTSAGYVRALMRDGAARYVENVDLPIKALQIGEQVLPIVVNPGKSEVSDVCSPSAHYVLYTVEEFRKSHSTVADVFVRGAALPFGALLRGCGIDRVIFVNNWLFTTNPAPTLSAEQIGAATERIIRACPEYAIAFRSINALFDRDLMRSLTGNGYRLVRSRRVYVLDCSSRTALEHNNVQIDLKLLRRSPYAVVDCRESADGRTSRMAELYRAVYLSKHSLLNPHFTAEFFRLTLKEGAFAYRALDRGPTIDGFVSFFCGSGRMTGAVLGYDRRLPQKSGLYRILIAILISEAAERRLPLNLSGGAGGFKLLRGAEPVDEYDAVYDRHLAVHRRVPWAALEAAGRLASLRRSARFLL